MFRFLFNDGEAAFLSPNKQTHLLNFHIELFDEFVQRHCDVSIDKANVYTPLSNILGCYWHYVTFHKNIKWGYFLNSELCVQAITTVMEKQYDVRIIGPSQGDDTTNYRTAFGISLKNM